MWKNYRYCGIIDKLRIPSHNLLICGLFINLNWPHCTNYFPCFNLVKLWKQILNTWLWYLDFVPPTSCKKNLIPNNIVFFFKLTWRLMHPRCKSISCVFALTGRLKAVLCEACVETQPTHSVMEQHHTLTLWRVLAYAESPPLL